MSRTNLVLIALNVVLITASVCQDSRLPDLSRFARSDSEHEIIILDKAFVVRSVTGTTLFRNGASEPLPRVLFEIVGPGPVTDIRRATSDQSGRFKIKQVPPGTYRFKTTCNGFSSIVGTITVSSKADKSARITLDVPIGN